MFFFFLRPQTKQTSTRHHGEICLCNLASFGMQKHLLTYFPAYLSSVSQSRTKGGFAPSCQTARRQRELRTHRGGEYLNIPNPQPHRHNYTRSPPQKGSRDGDSSTSPTRTRGYGSAAALQKSAFQQNRLLSAQDRSPPLMSLPGFAGSSQPQRGGRSLAGLFL